VVSCGGGPALYPAYPAHAANIHQVPASSIQNNPTPSAVSICGRLGPKKPTVATTKRRETRVASSPAHTPFFFCRLRPLQRGRGPECGRDWSGRHLRRYVHGARVAAARAALVPLAKRYGRGRTLQFLQAAKLWVATCAACLLHRCAPHRCIVRRFSPPYPAPSSDGSGSALGPQIQSLDVLADARFFLSLDGLFAAASFFVVSPPLRRMRGQLAEPGCWPLFILRAFAGALARP